MSPDDALRMMGLQAGASKADIKRRYRRLAKQTHPDTFTDPDAKRHAEEAFKRLQEAVRSLAQGYEYTSPATPATPQSAGPFEPVEVYGGWYAYSIVHNPFRHFVVDWLLRPAWRVSLILVRGTYAGCATMLLAAGVLLVLALPVSMAAEAGPVGWVALIIAAWMSRSRILWMIRAAVRISVTTWRQVSP